MKDQVKVVQRQAFAVYGYRLPRNYIPKSLERWICGIKNYFTSIMKLECLRRVSAFYAQPRRLVKLYLNH